MFELLEEVESKAIIKVIGVGGGGNNAVESMITTNIHGVEFIIANTDIKSIRASKAKTRIQLGIELTKGLGAGTRPDVGREAALESRPLLIDALKGADMVFIAAGMGGGTGTGAAPIIAEVAREAGILTIGIVTKPFTYEGKAKMEIATKGITELKKHVDSLIIISNDRIISQASKKMSLFDAFKPADDVLSHAVQGISELIMSRGLINLDFADVRTVMSVRGMAMMGTGIGTGENKCSMAVDMAISSPLLEENDIAGAKGILINITGSSKMTMADFDAVNRIVTWHADENATIKIGVVRDESLADAIKVIVIATGYGENFDSDTDSKQAKNLNIRSGVAIGKDYLDTPTFQRDLQKNEKSSGLRLVSKDESSEDEYHIPTFMRKQLD